MPSQYPGSLDTTTSLSTAVNGLSTPLNGDHTSGATTITVASTSGAPSAGYVYLDSEVVKYAGVTPTTLTGCTRGADGTAAASHSNGTTVKFALVADHHNSLVSAVIAVQNKVGLNTNGASASSIDAGQLAAGSSASITGLTASGLVTGAGLRDSRGAAGANAMVKILPDQLLGAPSGTITFAPIPQVYNHLLIYWYGRATGLATNDDTIAIRFGTGGGPVDTAADYNWSFIQVLNAALSGIPNPASTFAGVGTMASQNAPANQCSSGSIFIPAYSGTTFVKSYQSNWMTELNVGAAGLKSGTMGGNWNGTGAITSISMVLSSGGNSFATGCLFSIYAF